LGKTSPYHIPRDEVEAFIECSARQGDGTDVGKAMDDLLRRREWGTGQRMALIVEDDTDTRTIFELTLQAAGFTTSVVETGEAALTWLKSMVPSVLVLDLHLPDVSGVDILHRIRSNPDLTDLPVIVATAYPDMAKSIRDEVDFVLVKPVRFEVLQGKAVSLARAASISS
jgi:CheY-like chemotaxis protein